MNGTGKARLRRFVAGSLASAGLGLAAEGSAEPLTHDGFYLQLNTGLGYLTSSASRSAQPEYSGVSFPSGLLVGGSPMPGLVLGGMVLMDYAPSTQISETPYAVPTYLVGIGPFINWYLDPKAGFYFQGMVGFGALETSDKPDGSGKLDSSGADPMGLVLALGAGYDWWIGNEWAVGVMGRVAYGAFSFYDTSYLTIAPAVLVTLTYN